MGLDVYVGSLTRYCTEGPADVVERIARHQGMAVADGQEAEEVIWAAVLRWWENLSRWLGDRLARPLDRDESSPAPCVTDKPGWDGYGGPCCWPPTTSIPSCRPRPWSPPTGPTTSPTSRLGPGGRLPLLPAAHPGAVAALPVRVHRPHPGPHRRGGRAQLQRGPARAA